MSVILELDIVGLLTFVFIYEKNKLCLLFSVCILFIKLWLFSWDDFTDCKFWQGYISISF